MQRIETGDTQSGFPDVVATFPSSVNAFIELKTCMPVSVVGDGRDLSFGDLEGLDRESEAATTCRVLLPQTLKMRKSQLIWHCRWNQAGHNSWILIHQPVPKFNIILLNCQWLLEHVQSEEDKARTRVMQGAHTSVTDALILSKSGWRSVPVRHARFFAKPRAAIEHVRLYEEARLRTRLGPAPCGMSSQGPAS